MSEPTLRRTNWTSHDLPPRRPLVEDRGSDPRQDDDPLAELARIVGRGDPFIEQPKTPPRPEPSERPELRLVSKDDFLGVDADAFEAALQGAVDDDGEPEPGPAPLPRMPFSGDFRRQEPRFDAVTLPPLRQAPPPPPPAELDETGLDEGFLQSLDQELFGDAPRGHDAFAGQDSYGEAEPLFSEDAPIDPLPEEAAVEPSAQRKRPALGLIAAFFGLLTIGTGGAIAIGYTFFSGGSPVPGSDPPTVHADTRPNRVTPDPAADAQQPGKVIYDRLGSTNNPRDERVVPREEQPVDQNANFSAPRSIVPGSTPAPSALIPEPRRVTTTTIRVRPDGTLESEPTRASSTSTVVADAGPTPPLPSQTTGSTPPMLPTRVVTTSTIQVPAQQPSAQTPAVAPAAPAPSPAPVPASVAPPGVTPTFPAPTRVPQVARQQPTPPPPAPTPAPAATNAPFQLSSVPPTPPRAPAPAVDPAPASVAQAPQTGSYFVQVSSQKSEEAARQIFADLQKRYGAILGSMTPNIRTVDLPDKGTFYRVRVGPMANRDDANAFCAKLRAAGGACVVDRN